ncbi:MAG: fimbrillin family protein [Clostridium sp.]|nr:fimbrillin family protein [Clostridium sp.]
MTDKLKIYMAAAAVALLASACSDKKEAGPVDDGSVEVAISTDVITRANVTTSYKSGDAMNVFAKSYNSIESGDKVSGIRAEFNGTTWTASPAIRLKEGEVVFAFAVSPYDASYTNGAAIPVDISKQIDLLYSGGSSAANFTGPSVHFNMNHAMALASFNIVGDGQMLNSISIVGNKFYTKATFNIENGRFTGTGQDQYTLPCASRILESGWTDNYPQMWVVPFNTKTSEATLIAVIDGKTYTVPVPEVEMQSGFQYIFRLVLTNVGLVFDPSRTETISLNVATDNFGDVRDHGILRFGVDAAEWRLPTLTGNGVFGVARDTRGEAFTYQADIYQDITFGSAAGNTVEIETWNSNGFTIDQLTGVTTIDISEY